MGLFQKSDQQRIQHVSLVLKEHDDEQLITPRGAEKMSQDGKAAQPVSNKKEESPFVQIGSKLKSIFGNFFKTSDKLNKSYEEYKGDIILSTTS